MHGYYFLSVPNYTELITDFSDLVTPAMVSISLYLPLATIFPLFKWLFFGINDSKNQLRSIWDYGGINLSNKKKVPVLILLKYICAMM